MGAYSKVGSEFDLCRTAAFVAKILGMNAAMQHVSAHDISRSDLIPRITQLSLSQFSANLHALGTVRELLSSRMQWSVHRVALATDTVSP